MKTLVSLAGLSLLAIGVSASDAADAPDPAGFWKWEIRFGDRSRESFLKLSREGDRLTGVMPWPSGEEIAIGEARFADGELSFSVTRGRDGRTFTTRYRGRVTDNTIQGTIEYQRRGESLARDWHAVRASGSEPAFHARDRLSEMADVEADIDLNDDNYAVWRDHILPELSEMAWTQIPWLSTFKDGVLAADAADKPLLLWTMNGHPLGCT